MQTWSRSKAGNDNHPQASRASHSRERGGGVEKREGVGIRGEERGEREMQQSLPVGGSWMGELEHDFDLKLNWKPSQPIWAAATCETPLEQS